MKLYLVECQAIGGDNDKFLLYANNKKEAFDKVWKEYYIKLNLALKDYGRDTYCKKDLQVQEVDKIISSYEDGIFKF